MAAFEHATGLGRGSLYNFFPGGKQDMAQAVLDDIDDWFRERLFTPLRAAAQSDAVTARHGVMTMFADIDAYFRSGRRVCLQGAFATSCERDRFAHAVAGYFSAWREALGLALKTAGVAEPQATATRMLAAIQGGIVLARALDDPAAFTTTITGAMALMASA